MTAPARGSAALAGAVAAGAALAAGELPSALAGETSSLITAVGDQFVDRFAASLKDVAVALFGTNDKVALVAGIVLTTLALGAAVGMATSRWRHVDLAAYAAFAAIGLAAGLDAAGASDTVMAVSAVVAFATGVATLRWLLHLASHQRARRAPEPGYVRVVDRRAFLAWTGGAGVAALGAGGGSTYLRRRAQASTGRDAIVLPAAADRAAIPGEAVAIAGLSPYVTPNHTFFRIDTALTTPRINVDSWRLRVSGLVERPYELTFEELLAMDLVEKALTIACVSNEVGGPLVGNAVWLGVPLRDVLERAGVRPEGTQVLGRSADGFTAGFPTAAATDGRVAMVAVGMNGEPLPFGHGFPARLVVAGLYGYVSATKWLTEIALTPFAEVDGYWIPRGWAKEAPIRTQSRIDVPSSRGRLAAGAINVAGVAWAPGRGIAKVEMQVDSEPWIPCTLGPVASDNTWVQWWTPWMATPGEHLLRVRATDGTGETQTEARSDPAPSGATGWHERRVRVA